MSGSLAQPLPPPVPAPLRAARSRGIGAAVALGSAVALATAWSLLPVFGTAVPSPADCSGLRCSDNALLLWILTQAGRNLYIQPTALFEAPIFHPMRHALAYSESMLSAAAVAAPIAWITGNPIVAYNAHYVGTIVLSVVGMYLLVRRITGDATAGLVAGALFGLATERGLWWDFPPALAVHWAPVLLWAWIRFLDAPSWRRGLGLGLALVAHMHAAAYHGLMLPLLLVPWAAVLAAFGPWPLRRWLASAVPLGIAAVAGAALYYPYLVVQEEMQYVPTGLAVALPWQYVWAIGHPLAYADWRMFHAADGFYVSPLTVYVLAAAALAAAVRPAGDGGGPRLGVQLAAALVLTALAAIVSLGLFIDTPFGILPGPLALLRDVPGIGSMRAVVRFMMLATVGRAIVAGIATAILLRRLSPRAGRLVALAVVVLAAADARILSARATHDLTVPPEWEKGYAWLAGTVPDTPIIEIPYGNYGNDAHYMVYALEHGRPLFNGYSANMPRFNDTIGRLPDDVAWKTLREAGIRYALVHPSRLLDHPLLAKQLGGLIRRRDIALAALDDTLVLAVPPAPRRDERPFGTAVPRDGWAASASVPGAERAIDGDLATHWQASSAKADVTFRLDLGREREVEDVVLDLGPHVLEYPRAYRVSASTDGETWTPIGGEEPTIPPFGSYGRDHRKVALRLLLTRTRARWIEIAVPAYPPNSWSYTDGKWGIHELRVFETPAAGAPAAAAK